MAGVTDRPFRQLCKKLGAGYAVSEMAASNPKLGVAFDAIYTAEDIGSYKPAARNFAASARDVPAGSRMRRGALKPSPASTSAST